MIQSSPIPEKYGFDFAGLEVGDILLSFGESKTAKRIAKATGGGFSHAMLYVGHSVIHAMPDGVYSKNPQRLLVSAPEHLGVLRLCRHLSTHEKDQLCGYARTWIGALYSVPEAGATLLLSKVKKSAISDKQFCSRLVAQAYAFIGVDLVKNPDYCSPNDFLRSPEVETIEGCIKRMNQAEIDFADSHDYNVEIQQATFVWLAKVRSLAERRKLGQVSKQLDVTPLLMQHPGFDKVITQYVINSGYANYARVDRVRNPHRYNPQAFVLLCSNKRVSIQEMIEEEQRSIDRDMKRRTENYANSKANYSQMPLQYFALEMELACDLLNELECRQHTLDAVRRASATT